MLPFGGLVSPETPVWIYLCLLISHNLSNGSDVETLEVQFTVFRAPNNKLQFQQTSLFNGHVIFTCNSQTLTDQPGPDWVTHTFTQEELEERRMQCVDQHHEHFTWFKKIEKTITVTADILQRRRGCMINSSGVSTFDEWGVNGEDFLTFEPTTLKWTPLSDLATPVAVEWNKQDSLIRDHVYGDFLNRICPKAHNALKLKRATWINESAQTDVDTLEDQFTVFRAPNNKLQFQQTSLLNGDVIFSCNSQTLKDQPRQDWVPHTFTQEELEERRWQCVRQHHEHFTWFKRIEETISVTAESLQRRCGCIISSSGVFAFDEWGVNGEAFLNFEPQTRKWTPLSDRATALAAKWNKHDIRNHVYGDFLHHICPKAQKTLKLKRATWINESAQTEMELHIFAKPIPRSTSTYLQCHVTASDLSGVRIQLTKDGVPLDYGVERIGPRPNGDGTVQMRVRVQTKMDTNKHYRCEAHSETVNKTVLFDHKNALAVAIGIAWGVVFLVTVVICIWRGQERTGAHSAQPPISELTGNRERVLPSEVPAESPTNGSTSMHSPPTADT